MRKVEVGTRVEVTVGEQKVPGLVVNDNRPFITGKVREGRALVAVQLRPGKDGRKYFDIAVKDLVVVGE